MATYQNENMITCQLNTLYYTDGDTATVSVLIAESGEIFGTANLQFKASMNVHVTSIVPNEIYTMAEGLYIDVYGSNF